MGWSQPFIPGPENKTRADLALELDLALNNTQTITHPVTKAEWDSLLDDVRCLVVEVNRRD